MKADTLIWVGRMDEVHGDTLIAFGHSEKEVETLLYKKYKEVAKYRNEYELLNGSAIAPRHGQRSKADFLDYFGGWIQPMHVGKAYFGSDDDMTYYPHIKAEYTDYQNAKAVDVEFNGSGMYNDEGEINGFMGDVKIEVKDANSANGYSSKLISGEHGLNDYEDEYGFTIGE